MSDWKYLLDSISDEVRVQKNDNDEIDFGKFRDTFIAKAPQYIKDKGFVFLPDEDLLVDGYVYPRSLTGKQECDTCDKLIEVFDKNRDKIVAYLEARSGIKVI